MNRAYRLALLCGALPLFVGVLIFLLWLITRWEWLMHPGIYTLYGGVAVFLIGAIALTRSFCIAFCQPERIPLRRIWLSTLGCAALLLSNFAVAVCIIASVVAIETCYTVIVHNASPQPLVDVRVFGGGCEAKFGPIPPEGVVQRSLWIQQEGQLDWQAVSGTTAHSETIVDYVTGSMGGHVTVTFNPDNTISVSHEARSR